jgi:hypothetical protein
MKDSLQVAFEEITMEAPLMAGFGGGPLRWQPEKEFWDLNIVPQQREAVQLDSGDFFTVWQTALDSFYRSPSLQLRLDLEAYLRSERHQKAVAVVSLEKEGETLLWEQRTLSDFVISSQEWNYYRGIWKLSLPSDLAIKLEQGKAEKLRLKVFFWNPGGPLISLKPLRLRVKQF